MTMPSPKLTPEIQSRLFDETDARFWASTGYAPKRKLDPKNPTDAAMIPVWQDIYKKVHAEWASGKLVTTYDHPVVAGLLQEAAHEMARAVDSMSAAIATPASDPIAKNAHADDAAAAHDRANAATQKAATYQPPSASPAIAAQAAKHVAAQISATNSIAAQAVANGIMHSTAPDAAPAPAPPPAPMHPADALDALQVARAPAAAAAVQTQTPSPDAPKPLEFGWSGKAIAVIGGCFAILMGAAILNHPEHQGRRYS
jgi:hypothetical protein